ncbi:MAG: polyketide biosynthesis methyltransferase [Clostridiales bacterium]|nr:MAG: polyketide biosynthesis methyltransferase [Clostridiales bacterium]
MKEKFEAVESTMLIPLMIKANETRKKNPRVIDNKAVSIVEKLRINDPKLDKFMSHEGVIARTILFDKEVSNYIEKHPNATCINLACGLDDRFSRVDNGKITWYDIDLEEVIKLRREFFEETPRRKIISASMLDENWTNLVEVDEDVLIIMEGVLMYFTEEEVKKVFEIIGNKFTESTLIVELMCKKAAKMSSKHDTVKHTEATFKWGVDDGREITDMFNNLELISETSFNVEMRKYSFRGWLFTKLPMIKNLNNRITVFKFK